MGVFRTNCLVLKSRNLGEADRVLVLLSEEHGKFEASVKGARRQRSRFVGNTLPFNYLKAMFFTGKGMHSLSQAELVHSFVRLREDLIKYAYVSFWVELVDGFLPERAEVNEIFRFVLASLIVLEQVTDPELLNLAFQIRLLNYLGYQPELELCVGCKRPVGEKAFFAPLAGGVLCLACDEPQNGKIPFNRTERDFYRDLLATDMRELTRFSPARTTVTLVEKILTAFIDVRFEKPMKARSFLESVRHEGKCEG